MLDSFRLDYFENLPQWRRSEIAVRIVRGEGETLRQLIDEHILFDAEIGRVPEEIMELIKAENKSLDSSK